MSDTALTTTRKQLRGYGASRYLARRLTNSIEPVAKAGSAYVYSLEETVTAIRKYRQRRRVQQATKATLDRILDELLARLGNVVEFVPGSDGSEIGRLARQTVKAMRQTDKALAEMKATVASMGQRVR